jgi:hypothetical protein
MVRSLFSEELAELHRHELLAAAAPAAHRPRLVARPRRRARRAALAAWLPRLRRRRIAPRGARPVVPSAAKGGLSLR